MPLKGIIARSNDKNKMTTDKNAAEVLGAAGTAVYESSRDIMPLQYAGGATHYNEIDTSIDRYFL